MQMKEYVAKRRLWLTAESRHAEAGETVKLPDSVGQILVGTGAVVAAQTYTPEPEPEPVDVVAMQPVWSVLEQRQVPSGERFRVQAADVEALTLAGAVRVPEPEPAKEEPKAKRQSKKASDD